MARNLGDLNPADVMTPETIGLMSAGLMIVVGVVLIIRMKRRKRPTPEEIEAARRLWLTQHGKLGGGEVLEIGDNTISYVYDVRGMSYTTSQDVSALEAHLPEDRWSIVGAVGVRYDPRNPANSMVLSETWTGLRQRDRNVS
jgi:hypothetical protein